MDLPVRPPLAPMLAAPVDEIPAGMAYQPKWDGFRALAFRDRDRVTLLSRSGRELTPYFPDVAAALRDGTPERCVLDGELVVIEDGALRFTRLLERSGARPHAVARLAATRPASMIVFDVLAAGDRGLLNAAYAERRDVAEALFAAAEPPLFLSPETRDAAVAGIWFREFEGNGLDGVVARPLQLRYHPGARAMYKIKHRRDADVVVGGFRLHKNSSPTRPLLGPLHLGLYDAGGLNWVGACSGFSLRMREELLEVLLPLALAPGSAAELAHPWGGPPEPGGPRRPTPGPRTGGPDADTYLLTPELVCEVTFDHLEDGRFRSSPAFVRFRPDRLPSECTFDQLSPRGSVDLRRLLDPGSGGL